MAHLFMRERLIIPTLLNAFLEDVHHFETILDEGVTQSFNTEQPTNNTNNH